MISASPCFRIRIFTRSFLHISPLLQFSRFARGILILECRRFYSPLEFQQSFENYPRPCCVLFVSKNSHSIDSRHSTSYSTRQKERGRCIRSSSTERRRNCALVHQLSTFLLSPLPSDSRAVLAVTTVGCSFKRQPQKISARIKY